MLLTELLVVIGIVSVLAAMLLPALTLARNKARLTTCLNRFKQAGVAIAMYSDDYNNIPFAFAPGSTQGDVGGMWGGLIEANQANNVLYHNCASSVFGLLHPYSGTMALAVCPLFPAGKWPLDTSASGSMCTGRDGHDNYVAGSCPSGTCAGRYYAYGLRANGAGVADLRARLKAARLDNYTDIAKRITFTIGGNMFSGEGIATGHSGTEQRDAGAQSIWGSTILSDVSPNAHETTGRPGLTLLAVDGAVRIHNVNPQYFALRDLGLAALGPSDVMYRRFEE